MPRRALIALALVVVGLDSGSPAAVAPRGDKKPSIVVQRAKSSPQEQQEQDVSPETEADQLLSPESRGALKSLEQARNTIAQARRLSGERKEKAWQAARGELAEAEQQFAQARRKTGEELAARPRFAAGEPREDKARRERLSRELAEIDLLSASIDFELARTYPPSSEQAVRHFTKAAEAFEKLHEKYRVRTAGLYARLWAGRCYQELGKPQKALEHYRELLELPAEKKELAFYRTKGLRHALECWTDPREALYEVAAERGVGWLKEARGTSLTSADGLAIRYFTALAYYRQAESLPAKDTRRKKLLATARRHFTDAAKEPGEFEAEARKMLTAIGDSSRAVEPGESAQADNFADAMARGQEALEAFRSAALGLQLARENENDEAVESLAAEKARRTQEALDFFRQALEFAKKEKPRPDEWNLARYNLAYMHWETGDYQQAAALGKELLEKSPDAPEGRQGALLALESLARLAEEDSAGKSPRNGAAGLEEIARLILDRWPNEPEAEQAALRLATLAARRGDLAQLDALLKRISPDAPFRANLELRSGQALWSEFLRGSAKPADERPAAEELEKWKTLARGLLEGALERAEEKLSPDPVVMGSVLALTQIYLDSNEAARGASWLEHPRLGLLAMAQSDQGKQSRPFLIETHKVALRTYVATRPMQVARARQALAELNRLTKEEGRSPDQLAAVRAAVGREIREQLAAMKAEGRLAGSPDVTSEAKELVDELAEQAGDDPAAVGWMAEAYFQLGGGLEVASGGEATSCFRRAAALYQKMLEAADSASAPEAAAEQRLALKLRLAECDLRMGEHSRALELLAKVLEERPTLLAAQTRAAEAFQVLGAESADNYLRAIEGGMPGADGKNRVWGWGRLARITMNQPKLAETFYQARLQMAAARHAYAVSQQQESLKNKHLAAAKQDIFLTYKLYPDLGGKKQAAQFEAVLKKIQHDLGQQEEGLLEFKKRDAELRRAASSPK